MSMFAISARLSNIIPQRKGQGAPPKAILRAMSGILSNIVRHFDAVELLRVPLQKAASKSILQIFFFVGMV
jgi:hypothetical protein